ncbi:MAG: TetR/AcrR family transcriptional regulator [Brevinematales bacterium]|jgi:AcrR family transcriptional regulator
MNRKDLEKESRKNSIIEAAEMIFREKSFEQSGMDEIAAGAQFTKRTVYSYFINKEDLFFAVALKISESYIPEILIAMEKGKTGFEKIREAGKAYYQFYIDNPAGFKIISFARTIHNFEWESPHHREMVRLSEKLFISFGKAISEGQKDGSIRKDLAPAKGAYFLAVSTAGILEMFSSNKPDMSVFSIEEKGFLELSLGLILDSIRPR